MSILDSTSVTRFQAGLPQRAIRLIDILRQRETWASDDDPDNEQLLNQMGKLLDTHDGLTRFGRLPNETTQEMAAHAHIYRALSILNARMMGSGPESDPLFAPAEDPDSALAQKANIERLGALLRLDVISDVFHLSHQETLNRILESGGTVKTNTETRS